MLAGLGGAACMDGQQPRAHPGTGQGVLGASTTARWGTTDGAQSQARVPEEEMLLAWRSLWGTARRALAAVVLVGSIDDFNVGCGATK